MITASAYDIHVEKLFGRMKRLHAAFSGAGIAYRIVGGMAVYLQVSERDPGKARLTRDVDVAVNRGELERIASVSAPFGFQFRHVAGVDMLLDNAEPRASSGIHLVFAGEKSAPSIASRSPASRNPRVRPKAFSSRRWPIWCA